MPDVPDAYQTHSSPGRLRLKIPSKKGDSAWFSSLKAGMADCPGVRSIDVNPLTGSVLVIHSVASDTIAEYARFCDFFSYNKADLNIHQRVSESFSDFDNNMRNVTGGGLDIGTTAFLALLGAGIYEIARGNFGAPAWYTAFWYAFNVFLKSK